MTITVFLDVTSCGLVGGYQRSEGTYRLHLQGEVDFEFLRNVGSNLQDHTTS